MNDWRSKIDVMVTSHGPFAAGSVLWRDAHGKLVCTVVAKATYDLAPGELVPLDVPLPLQEEEGHWDDDPRKSVHVPSDLAPFQVAAEIVVVGSAFARAAAPSVVARVLVGSIDKSLESFAPRWFRADGSVEESTPTTRFSLRYEHAAGGAGTENPAGIDSSRADSRGRFPIPQLAAPGQPPGAPLGFGPIATTWPARAGGLSAADHAWLEEPTASPLPKTFPSQFFQVAPPDQWLDRSIAADERLVLENLHADAPKLDMTLSGLEPVALVAGGRGEPLRLAGDLLFIDTDQGLCTLTFRGQIPVEEGTTRLRITVTGVPLGAPVDLVRRRVELEEAADLEVTGDALPDETNASVLTTTFKTPDWIARKPALPFAKPGSAPPPRPSNPGGALPFRSAGSEVPPPARLPAPSRPEAHRPGTVELPAISPATMALPVAAPLAPQSQLGLPAPAETTARAPTARGVFSSDPQPPVVAPPPMFTGRASSPDLLLPLSSPIVPRAEPSAPAGLPSLGSSSLPVPSLVSPNVVLRAEPPAAKVEAPADSPRKASSFDAAFGGKKPAPNGDRSPPRAGFDAAFGGVKAASDAAAQKEQSRDAARAKAEGKPAEQGVRRLAVVSLLHFDPKVVARLRTSRRFTSLFTKAALARGPQGVDEPRADPAIDKDRADVLRVLSCGTGAEVTEIRGALADSLTELTDLEPPLVLVGGELRPTFDEVETLRASVSIAQHVAAGDKKLLAHVTVAQEALSASVPLRPETALGLARQIEQASGSLSLPARYVASEVERMLLDGRKYKRRPLRGSPHVRAELTLPRSSDALTMYLPEGAIASLPLLLAFPVMALCEVGPREDLAEPQDEALFAVALGRVLKGREG